MGMFNDFAVYLPSSEGGSIEHVDAINNSTISNFDYMVCASSANQHIQPGQMLIRFSTSLESATLFFCHITIPKACLNASAFIILVDGDPISATQLPSQDNTEIYLYITYVGSSHEIVISIPELRTTIALLILTIATSLLAISLRRRRRNDQ